MELSHDELKRRQRALREAGSLPRNVDLKVHRAISWIGRAQREAEDVDARYLFLWVAFNAAYADERSQDKEWEKQGLFFDRLCALDGQRRLDDVVWSRLQDAIRGFLDNPYVFGPFWYFHNGDRKYVDWRERFARGQRLSARAVARRNTPLLLSILFNRLYILRNQMLHGGATWNSSINRDQLRDGSEILHALMPIIVVIMLDHASEDWGRAHYPVVEEPGAE